MKQLLTAFILFGFVNGAYADDILLTWTAPTEREDGSQIESIDRFNLYTTIDNVVQDVVEVPADATDFQLSEVAAGNYTFQISTIESGIEGDLSTPATVSVDELQQSKPVRIELTVRVIE